MKNKNICKFIASSISESLSVSCFILETNPENMKNKIHLKEHHLFLITQGNGTININGKEYPFNSGTLLFAFSNETFTASFDGECQYMYIRFSGFRSDELFRRFEINKNNRSFIGFDGLIPLWQESLSRADSSSIDLAAESMLLYTFSRFSGDTAKRNSLVNKIISISEESFTDTTLTINTIAEQISYNPKYISHIFKEKMGIGYSEYLRTLRIKFAVSLFEHGIDSVKNVALLSGFSDPLYFSTVFKKSTGLSPKEYKARNMK